MSSYCTLDEAFAGPPNPPMPGKSAKKSSKSRQKEMDPDRQALPPAPANDVLTGPPPSGGKVGLLESQSGVKLEEFFSLPGETADAETWEKAFMLEGSQIPPPRHPLKEMDVNGQPTLWRKIPVPSTPTEMAAIPSEVSARLDALTKQLESLTTPTPMQSTAELFLFVAIGLLILLAIDTLLRFATSMATRKTRMMGGAVPRGRWKWVQN